MSRHAFYCLVSLVAALFIAACHDSNEIGELTQGTPPPPAAQSPRPPDIVCGPDNCMGCCTESGCQPGNMHGACGKAGDACNECSDAEMCRTGTCLPTDTEPTPPPESTQPKAVSAIERKDPAGLLLESKSFEYDESGRVTQMVWVLLGVNTTMNIAYDTTGRNADVTVSTTGLSPSPWSQEHWTLDGQGRITRIDDTNLALTPPVASVWTYEYSANTSYPINWSIYADIDGIAGIDIGDGSSDTVQVVDALYNGNGQILNYEWDYAPLGANIKSYELAYDSETGCIMNGVHISDGTRTSFDYTCVFADDGKLIRLIRSHLGTPQHIAQFEYDEDGMLVRRTNSFDGDARVDETITYTYVETPEVFRPRFVPNPIQDARNGLDGLDIDFFMLTPMM